jgi:lysophospholipase L1-like esterase
MMSANGVAELFERVLRQRKHPKIKLLGDSITHGVGGSGWEQNGNLIVEGWNESPNGYSWANLFRDYMKEKYDAVVVNKACTGTNVEFLMKHFSVLVDSDDDLIVCTIGTNNRHKYFKHGDKPERDEFFEQFCNTLKQMYGMFQACGIPTVFVANIPASEENEKDGKDYWRILHMCDINDGYKKLARDCDAPVLSMYDLFCDYCKENGLTPEQLLCDGVHPNDQGYKVIFELLIKEFGV